MDIRLKESMYVNFEGVSYLIPHNSIGVVRGNLIAFYDSSKNVSVAFTKDFCVQNSGMFTVAKTLSDRDVSVDDVLAVIKKAELPDKQKTLFSEKILSLL